MAGDRMVTIVQALPRRVHLRAPRLAWHRSASEHVAEALVPEGDFDRVTVRPSTGSVVVEGPEGALSAEKLAARLEELLKGERDDQGKLLAGLRPEDHPGPTRIARALVRAVSGINEDVRTALDDRADLGTLLPVFFAAAGAYEVTTTGQLSTPTWFNLLWWSLRSFMTFNIRAVEEQVQGVAEPDLGSLANAL
jgi:hypothetical protein